MLDLNSKIIIIFVLIVVVIGFIWYKYRKSHDSQTSQESFSSHESLNPLTISNTHTKSASNEIPIDSNDVSHLITRPTATTVANPETSNSAHLLPKTSDPSYPNIHMPANSTTYVNNTSCGSLYIASPGTSKKNASLDIRQDVPITKNDDCIAWNKSPLEPYPHYCKLC